MTITLIGEIIKKNGTEVSIKERKTGKVYAAKLEIETSLDLNIGDAGLFMDTKYDGTEMIFTKAEIRQFLDPLYEDTIISDAGSITFIPVIQDPFGQVFLDKRKLDEAANV